MHILFYSNSTYNTGAYLENFQENLLYPALFKYFIRMLDWTSKNLATISVNDILLTL